jgi:hypothetical protein
MRREKLAISSIIARHGAGTVGGCAGIRGDMKGFGHFSPEVPGIRRAGWTDALTGGGSAISSGTVDSQ